MNQTAPAGWRPAVILFHRGHGPAHHDLLLAAGRRCPTLQLGGQGRHLQTTWLTPHRRHYLTFTGSIPGKGRVDRCWRGWARILGDGRLLQIALADPRRLRLVRLKGRSMLCHRPPASP